MNVNYNADKNNFNMDVHIYEFGHYLDNAGYTSAYYDYENSSCNIYTYSFSIPSNAS